MLSSRAATEVSPLTPRMTMRGLVRDFGKAGLAIIATLACAVLAASTFRLAGARNTYFAVAGFHGYVEGVMLVYLLVRGGSNANSSAPRDRARAH